MVTLLNLLFVQNRSVVSLLRKSKLLSLLLLLLDHLCSLLVLEVGLLSFLMLHILLLLMLLYLAKKMLLLAVFHIVFDQAFLISHLHRQRFSSLFLLLKLFLLLVTALSVWLGIVG